MDASAPETIDIGPRAGIRHNGHRKRGPYQNHVLGETVSVLSFGSESLSQCTHEL
jgi:hypothetical protein